MTSTSAPQAPHLLLQLPARAEMGHPVVSDDHRVSRLRIARFAAFARADFESSEPPQLDDAVSEEPGLDLLEEQVDDLVDVLLADLDQGEDVFDDFGLGKLFPGHGGGPLRLHPAEQV